MTMYRPTADFSEKITQLQNDLTKAQTTLGKERCVPVILIAAAASPVLIGLVLYLLSPSFVQVRDGAEYKRSTKKVLSYTALLSICICLGIYLFTYCNGYDATSMCVRF